MLLYFTKIASAACHIYAYNGGFKLRLRFQQHLLRQRPTPSDAVTRGEAATPLRRMSFSE